MTKQVMGPAIRAATHASLGLAQQGRGVMPIEKHGWHGLAQQGRVGLTRSRLCRATCLAALAASACGCALDRRFHDDIVSVSTFADKRNPWLNFDNPPRSVPGGIRFPVYLTGPSSPLGVFGDGTLRVDMYRVDRGVQGEELPAHIKEWSYDTKQAYDYGFRERQRAGWGYQLRLNWEDADVLGKEVMLVVSFIRHDGRVIQGKRIYFKVPMKV